MPAESHALSTGPAPAEVPPPSWTWFHAAGSRAELDACLDRMRARGWTISDEEPRPAPFGTWDVIVRPPVR